MNEFSRALVYLNDPFNWSRPSGITDLALEHLAISAVAVLAAAVLALPVGVALGTARRGAGLVVVLSNVSRAVPTLALLTLFAVSPIGFGNRATTIALAVFAVPPILTNTFVGFRGVDPEVREAARGMGMSRGQVLGRVELPLALPLVTTGIRTAAVQVVATAALAAFVNGGGLGEIISAGFGIGMSNGGGAQIVAGGIAVALLALLVEGMLATVQRLVTPKALRTRRRPGPTAAVPAG